MRFSTIAMALSALFAVGFAAPSPPSGDPSSPGCVGGFCGNNLVRFFVVPLFYYPSRATSFFFFLFVVVDKITYLKTKQGGPGSRGGKR